MQQVTPETRGGLTLVGGIPASGWSLELQVRQPQRAPQQGCQPTANRPVEQASQYPIRTTNSISRRKLKHELSHTLPLPSGLFIAELSANIRNRKGGGERVQQKSAMGATVKNSMVRHGRHVTTKRGIKAV